MPSTHDAEQSNPALSPTCEFCGGQRKRVELAGELASSLPAIYEPCGCPQARAALAEARKAEFEASAEDRRRRIYSALRSAGIPERYLEASLEDSPDARSYLDILKDGKGLYFSGESGVGKTHMAAILAKQYVLGYRSVAFSDVDSIKREVTAAWDTKGATEKQIIDRWVNADLAVIDDVGAEAINDVTATVLRAIIYGREANGKVTIITSNFTREQLAVHISTTKGDVMARRMASRIKGMTEHVVLEGPDRRIER